MCIRDRFFPSGLPVLLFGFVVSLGAGVLSSDRQSGRHVDSSPNIGARDQRTIRGCKSGKVCITLVSWHGETTKQDISTTPLQNKISIT